MTQPDDRAVRRFVAKSLAVRIATLSPAGNADLIPLWFVEREGRLYMAPRPENPVVRDLKQNPEVVLLLHGDRRKRPDRVLRIRGNATFRTEPEIVAAVQRLALRRYYLSAGGLWNALRNVHRVKRMRQYYAERGGESGVIEVVPDTAEFLRLPQWRDRS